jgi:hypothetical protein
MVAMFAWLSGERVGLAAEAVERIGVAAAVGQEFQGNVAIEPGVAGAIDLAHAACTCELQDLVGPDASAGAERHRSPGSAV